MTNKLDTKITVRANSELKQQFAEKAKANGTTPTALINQLMSDYVNSNTTSTTTARPNETQQTEKTETSALEEKLAQVEEKTSQQHETLINCLNQLRDRVDKLEQWKEPIKDSLQADYQAISELREKVETLEASTNSTDSTNKNNETPASEEKNGGYVDQQRENGEAPIPQPQDKIRHQSTTSTDTALTEETEYSESLTTEEAEGSAIAPRTQAELEKKLGIPKTYISKWKKGNDVPKTKESKNWEVYQEWLNWEEFSPDNSKRLMWRRKL